MAIANSDGSIVLTTKVEDSGLKKGMEKIISEQKAKLQSLTREYAKLITNNQQNTEEAKKLKREIDNLSKSIKQNETILKSFGESSSEALEQTSEAVENSSKSFSKFQSALKSIAGYLALAFSVTKIIQFSNESANLATQTEASVQRLVDIYGEASDAVGDFIDQNARALGMSKSAAASFSSVYGNLFSVWADQATNAELTNRYLQMTAVVASKTGRTVEDVQERVRSGLLGNTEAIEDLGIFVNVKTIEMTDAFQRMANGKSWEQLDAYTQQQIRSMAILEQATAKYGDEVADTSATIRNRYKAAYQDFQNSWGNIVNTVLLPVLETLTQIFDIATKGLNALSGRGGQILENVELQEENTNKTAENIEEQTKNQKELNKEMKKSLAGFDDIQILSSKTAENIEVESKNNNTDFNLGENPTPQNFSDGINAQLLAIMAVVGVSLVAVGLILIYFGQIAWGVGFIIAGAADLSVTAAAVASEFKLPKEVISGILLAIQAIATAILGYIGIVLIIIGIIALCTGVGFGIGISLILMGAGSLVAAVAINFNHIINIFKSVIEIFKTNVLVGIGLILLGTVLLLNSATLGPGIAMIGAGLGALAIRGVTTNSGFLSEKIQEVWSKVKEVWNNEIKPSIDEVGKAFEDLYNEHIKPIIDLIVKYVITPLNAFVDFIFKIVIGILFDGLILGLDLVGAAINGAFGAFAWFIDQISNMITSFKNQFIFVVNLIIDGVNTLIDGLNKLSIKTPNLSILGDFAGIDIGFNIPKIPKLAQGAVIPPNREFLAILGDQKRGTNIEAPLDTIVDAFNIALSQNGGNTKKEEHYYLNETELMRIVYKLFKGGENLNGLSLESGGF